MALAVLSLLPAAAPPDAPARPLAHLALAVRHLARLPEDDRLHTRFLSWQAVPRAKVADGQRVVRWWLNQLSTAEDMAAPEDVPGTGGILWAIDLRDYNWTPEAWHAVASREPYFRSPWLDGLLVARAAKLVGETSEPGKDGTAHAIAVVRADWLFRETVESARSPSYYDLLFAKRRFAKPAPAPTPERKRVEKYVPGVGTVVEYEDAPAPTSAEAKANDFPATEADWNEFFGIKDAVAFIQRTKIDPRRGAIVAGSKDDPARGSIVARNNRVVQVLRSPWGVALKTFDAKTSSGDTDYIEKAPEVAVGKIKADAGELLASLPNGGQAGLLIDGAGKRIEFATGEFTHPQGPDKRTPDVRTMMGCVICHAPDGGFIPPRDTFRELLEAGVDLKIKDRVVRNRTRAFFLGWSDEIAGYQRPYQRLVERATKGMKPVALAAAFMALRDWYDDPVTPAQAAAEFGLSVEEFKLGVSRSAKARLGLLAAGRSIPRETWERGVFREAGLLLAAKKER